MMNNKILLIVILILLVIKQTFEIQAQEISLKSKTPIIDDYNIVWDSPSNDATGSMPLGNGDIGINFWVEPSGDMVFYISKVDAFSNNQTLLKLGCIRVRLDDNPLEVKDGMPLPEFKQTLDISTGQVTVDIGRGEVAARVWVDANRPVIHVDMTSRHPRTATASYSNWRVSGPEEVVVEDKSDRVLWYHRNESSVFSEWMLANNVEALLDTIEDPLLHRTFGGWMESRQLTKTNSTTLDSRKPLKEMHIALTIMEAITPTAEEWTKRLTSLAQKTRNENATQAFYKHSEWWKAVVRKNYIRHAAFL